MRRAVGRVVIIVLMLAATAADRVMAQDQDVAYTAAVRSGDCEGNLGETVAPLTDPIPGSGPSVGQAPELITATSFTTIPIALDQLVEDAHAIGIERDGGDAVLACGDLGGTLTDQGALIIGLRERDASGVTGIVYLAPSLGGASQTDISVLLAETATATTEPPEPSTSDTPASAETEAVDADAVDAVATPGGGTADAVFTNEERQYATTLARQSTLVIASLRRVDALFENPQIGDEGWTNQLAAELTLWQILNREAQEIEPPPAFADVHATYLDALGLLDSAASDIFSGLSGGNQDRISKGTESIEQAVGRLGEASNLVDELAAERES